MAATSLEAVKRKIRFLQEQADGAEEKAERLQMQLLVEKKAREQVSIFLKSASSQTGAAIAKPSSCSLLLCYVKQLELMHRETAERRPQCCELSFVQWHHCTQGRLMPSGFNWSLTGPSRNGY